MVRWRRWTSLILLALAALAMVQVDRELKQAPHAGFAPADALWTAYSPDLAYFLGAISQEGPLAGTREAIAPTLGDFQLRLRQLTGVRPTPGRWRLYMGPQVLLWRGSSGGWGACFHPGLLPRILLALGSSVDPATNNSRFGELSYAWRGRFLIVCSSPKELRAALGAPLYPANAGPPQRLLLAWPGPNSGSLTLDASPALRVKGEMALQITRRKQALPVLGHPALVSLSAASSQDLLVLLELALRASGAARLWTAGQSLPGTGAFAALPPTWEANVGGEVAALSGVEIQDGWPLPKGFVLMKGNGLQPNMHPLRTLAEGAYSLPYRWGLVEGSITPVWGELLSLSLAQQQPFYVAASHQDEMERALQQAAGARSEEADLVLEVDWTQLGAAAQQLMPIAAELEMISQHNARDLEAEYLPVARSLAGWGQGRIKGVSTGQSLQFEGVLLLAEPAP